MKRWESRPLLDVYVTFYGHVECSQNDGFKTIVWMIWVQNMTMHYVDGCHFLCHGYLLLERWDGYSRRKTMADYLYYLILHI